jgi:hypothetical protein
MAVAGSSDITLVLTAYLNAALQLPFVILVWALVIRPDNISAKSKSFLI